MSLHIMVWMLLLSCSLYAAIFGGKSGLAGAGINIIGTLGTFVVQSVQAWHATHIPVMIVDLLVMIGFYALAMNSKVYWPIWAAGFHLITVAGHLATVIIPGFWSTLYYYFNGMWAVFIQMAMVWGVMLDRIRRGHGQ
jgi:hypothetical protein